jgi:GxxExxY protein
MNSENDPQTYAIIGAAMEVHRELRQGFLESVYGDALAVELASRDVPFEREALCPVHYKGGVLPTRFTADFICFGEIIVELKAVKSLSEIEDAQVINYLKITRYKRAMLLNFGARSLQHKRFVLQSEHDDPPNFRDQ